MENTDSLSLRHYMQDLEIDHLEKIALLLKENETIISQYGLDSLNKKLGMHNTQVLQNLRNAFRNLCDLFIKHLSQKNVDAYCTENINTIKTSAYHNVTFNQYNEVIGLFEETSFSVLLHHAKDKQELASYLSSFEKVCRALVNIAADIYFSANDQLIMSLAKLSKLRDIDTGAHLERTQRYSVLLAKEMGLDMDTIETIRRAAPLHDIGRIALSDNLLRKHDNEMSEEEKRFALQHTVIGAEIIDEIIKLNPLSKGFLSAAKDMALYHHEHFDGSGSPKGLSGNTIPLSARILAVADFYDTVRSVRKQKSPWTHAEAVEYIQENSGSLFYPAAVNAFLLLQSEFEKISNEEPDAPEQKKWGNHHPPK